MDAICDLSLCALSRALKKREISVTETVKACLSQIEATEPRISALLYLNGENALGKAQALDREGPDGEKTLWGVPVIVKDALSTKDQPTTAASRILENFNPIYDAFAVSKLREAGAIILGKANMDEFAMGSSTENSAFQKTRNPWDLNRTPGGSSGGSAASVSALQCFASLGSDTGGSIRQPAAFCGCVGLKPTYGRVSRYGLFAFASSLDQIGPFARNVEDCAVMLETIAGYDQRDNTSVDVPVDAYGESVRNAGERNNLAGFKIGFPEDFFGTGLDEEVKKSCLEAIHCAERLGAEIVPLKLPSPEIASAVYYIIAMAEASSNLARYDGVRYGRRAAGANSLDELYIKSRSQGFGKEVKRRIMLGSYVLSAGYYDAYFLKAAQTRRIIFNHYNKALEKCDFICMPVAPAVAWKLGSHEEDPLKMYLTDAYTLPVNLAGLPALSLPVGFGSESQMPVAIQLVGPRFGEKTILEAAKILENNLPKLGLPPMQFSD